MDTVFKHLLPSRSSADDDVVDGNVNEFDEKPDESHDGKADGRCHGDLRELLPVRLGAPLDQTHRILGELANGLQLQKKGIHGVFSVEI